MANVIKLRKGLDINLKGVAAKELGTIASCDEYALVPGFFEGVYPKVVVKEGDTVRAGEALFVNKNSPDVKFASPVSGTVTAVKRGLRRKVLAIKVKADKQQEFVVFDKADVHTLTGGEVKKRLCESGLFGFINQLPYAVSAVPADTPKAIFVSALRDMPLEGDFEFELKDNERYFQTGLTALSKIAKTYLGIGKNQTSTSLVEAKDVEVNIFDGPCPAGNVDVQINHISPVNKGETVWTVDPTAVIFFGRLFEEGKVDMTRTVAVAGSQMAHPCYVKALVGTSLKAILKDQLTTTDHVRLLNGNPLTGVKASLDDYLGAHTSVVSAIPEGDNVDELLGWILPRTNEFSVNRSYCSWLFGKKAYDLDARVKGGERHMIMSGEYDRVLPMDIYAEYLVKAVIAGDIDKQEQLGIYEVAPEDFALAEFVDSSKLPLQKIIRDGLNVLRKENA